MMEGKIESVTFCNQPSDFFGHFKFIIWASKKYNSDFLRRGFSQSYVMEYEKNNDEMCNNENKFHGITFLQVQML